MYLYRRVLSFENINQDFDTIFNNMTTTFDLCVKDLVLYTQFFFGSDSNLIVNLRVNYHNSLKFFISPL